MKRLLRLDEDVDLIFPPGKRFHLVIVGGSALNDRSYRQFRANYDEYVKRYRPCGS